MKVGDKVRVARDESEKYWIGAEGVIVDMREEQNKKRDEFDALVTMQLTKKVEANQAYQNGETLEFYKRSLDVIEEAEPETEQPHVVSDEAIRLAAEFLGVDFKSVMRVLFMAEAMTTTREALSND